ncbi:hypothetical protein GYY_06800 [Methanococcus maripaludis X1]|uniref:Uncharacterized protein n=1 Tax=Methanococcus maripaludis X1 TaxID=1053692 RepID=G0H162_METMI|nr:hypothetical protein GYY_06800 [Methanococcus maripaludis X1]
MVSGPTFSEDSTVFDDESVDVPELEVLGTLVVTGVSDESELLIIDEELDELLLLDPPPPPPLLLPESLVSPVSPVSAVSENVSTT